MHRTLRGVRGTAETAARAPSLPGRRGAARQGGCVSVSATRAACAYPPRASQVSEAASARLRPRTTGCQKGRERNNRYPVLETAASAVIHNPADRKPAVTSLPTVAQPKRSRLHTAAGTFVSPYSEPASSGSGSEGASGNGRSRGAER